MSAPDGAALTPDGRNRRALLRAGLGAVAVGAWVAPQVLLATPAFACTPLTKWLQINPGACGAGEQSTTIPIAPEPVTCVPSGWQTGRIDGVTYACSTTSLGGSITITKAGCTPTSATAIKYCPNASGAKYSCVNGSISGNVVTFAAITGPNPQGCLYLKYRVKLSCC